MIRRVILMVSLVCLANEPVYAGQPIATEDEVFALEPAALSGDRESVRALFNLYSRADGAVYEYIDVVLGRTIFNYPQLFLEELLRTGPKTHLEGLLGNTGEDLVDKFEEQAAELRMRQKALGTVSNPSLLELRDLCVRELDRQITKLDSIAAQRIRIDRESEANHDLIQLLDKPISIYKQISFFDLGRCARVRGTQRFHRRVGTRPVGRLMQYYDVVIKRSGPPVLGEWMVSLH